MKKFFTLTNLSNIALFITILILLGVNSFIQISADGQVNFWEIGLRSLLILLSVVLVSNIVIEKKLNGGDKSLAKEMTLSENYEKTLDVDFDSFLVYDNRETKKKAFIKKVNRDIKKLDKKAKEEDLALFFMPVSKMTEAELEEHKQKQLKNKFCIKRYALMEKLQPEWLEKHILTIDVKYPEIKALDLRLNDIKDSDEEELKLKPASIRVKNIIPKMFYGVTISVFLSLIVIRLIENTADAWIGVGLDFMMLLANIQFGISVGNSVINQSYLKFYIMKNALYQRYFKWSAGNPGSKVLKLIEMIEKEAVKKLQPEVKVEVK